MPDIYSADTKIFAHFEGKHELMLSVSELCKYFSWHSKTDDCPSLGMSTVSGRRVRRRLAEIGMSIMSL